MLEKNSYCVSAFLNNKKTDWGISLVKKTLYKKDFDEKFSDYEIICSNRIRFDDLKKTVGSFNEKIPLDSKPSEKSIIFGPKIKEVEEYKAQFNLAEFGEKKLCEKTPNEILPLIRRNPEWRKEKNKELQKLLANPHFRGIQYCSKIQGVYCFIQQPSIIRM